MARTDNSDDVDGVLVVRDGCVQCGFEPLSPGRLAGALRELSSAWWERLHQPHVARRPAAQAWSALEHAAHLLDVTAAFNERFTRILGHDDGPFPSVDAAAAALEGAYADADPTFVAEHLDAALEDIAQRLAWVPDEAWNNSGQRSDGAAFTLASLGNHFLHELRHRLAAAGGVQGL